jgi:hypothetical protein
MIGHQEIIALRMRRLLPEAVVLTDTPAVLSGLGSVLIEPEDTPRADLRWLVDAKVTLHFRDESRMAQWAAAAHAARARWVRTYRRVERPWPEGVRIECRDVRKDGTVIVDGIVQ